MSQHTSHTMFEFLCVKYFQTVVEWRYKCNLSVQVTSVRQLISTFMNRNDKRLLPWWLYITNCQDRVTFVFNKWFLLLQCIFISFFAMYDIIAWYFRRHEMSILEDWRRVWDADRNKSLGSFSPHKLTSRLVKEILS